MERPLFSDMLAERRRQLGFSISQASRVLRLREDVLVAFEEGDFGRMPKSGYAQGMLSSYARYLGLDATEVVEAYLEDSKRYRRSGGRDGGAGTVGPSRASRTSRGTNPYTHGGDTYVAPRGLLPSSGGFAGDLGSFATTRVRSRGSEGGEQLPPMDPAPEYPQSRPYTGRVPSAARTQRMPRVRDTRERGDVHTMRYDSDEFEDDLHFDREARAYESASTRRGRSSSRNLGNTQRPRVQRSGSRGGSGSRSGSRRPSVVEQLLGDSSRLVLLVGVVVVILLSVILILSVSSCVRNNSDSGRTVPVSLAAEADDGTTGTDNVTQPDDPAATDATTTGSEGDVASQTSETDADGQSAPTGESDATTTTGSAKQGETSVSVSVANGAVTWLEVECDGKSDVADTITGPWQRTYTVEESLSVQASDTTAVSVVQNGRQLQFESMASGIGTLRVQGTSTKSKSKAKAAAEAAKDASEGSSNSAKIGNASSTSDSSAETDQEDAEGQEGSQETDEESYGESYGGNGEFDENGYYVGYGMGAYDEYGNYVG